MNKASRKRPRTASTDTNTPSSTNAEQAAVSTFLSSGCCILPNVLPPSFIQSCHDKATFDLNFLSNQLALQRHDENNNNHIKMAAAHRVDYREMVDRDGSRRDVRYQMDQYPYAAPGLIYNSVVYPILQQLLLGSNNSTEGTTIGSNGIQLLYMGIMWALPSGDQVTDQHQKWHGDGGHLYSHIHLPPHCINVFYPLVDIKDDSCGPTQVIPGSHKLGHFSDATLKPISLTCNAGDAILFDYRLKHRGLASGTSRRPVLYCAYSQPWFRDAGNTRSGRSILLDEHKLATSKPWRSRLLNGTAMPSLQDGFDEVALSSSSSSSTTTSHVPTNNAVPSATKKSAAANIDKEGDNDGGGAGEQWILFKLNIQLDDGKEETIVIHQGDVAIEVSTQFCLAHGLSKDFMPLLAQTIQEQINQHDEVA